MRQPPDPTRPARIARRRLAALVVALTAAVAVAAWATDAGLPGRTTASGSAGGTGGALGADDGYIPVGESVSPFARVPAVERLDPALRTAVRRAARAARADGIDLRVNSGWRSARYQAQLLRRAVRQHGSVEAARRFVKAPEDSPHVTGDAVDIGPTDADDWVIRHGTDYGLCQTYGNEMWHFERVIEPGGTCPPMRSDAAGR